MLNYINEKLVGPLLPIVLFTAGIFLTLRFGIKVFIHPIEIIKSLFKKKNGSSPFKAACLALSGTLGVGNIAGVAAAVSVGGAGAIFWMWISAFFAMIIKYTEVVIAMYFKKNGKGGPGYYIKQGLDLRFVAVIFSLLIVFSSFTVGNVVQSSAAAEAMNNVFGVSKLIVGIIIALVTVALICGGLKRVTAFSSAVIPVLSIGYILLSTAIIIRNIDFIPSVFSEIMDSAMTPCALLGGGGGSLINSAMRYGAARGILSNESGCGTAAYAHTSADNSPVEQGFWGIFEVFFDTILLCTLTAFVILLTSPSGDVQNGMALSLEAFGTVGGFGRFFIGISTAIYAIASIVCWSYYGIEALSYVTESKKIRRLYIFLYSAAGICGSVFAPKIVWDLSDFSVTLMAIINTVCLCFLSGTARKLTNEYFTDHISKLKSVLFIRK